MGDERGVYVLNTPFSTMTTFPPMVSSAGVPSTVQETPNSSGGKTRTWRCLPYCHRSHEVVPASVADPKASYSAMKAMLSASSRHEPQSGREIGYAGLHRENRYPPGCPVLRRQTLRSTGLGALVERNGYVFDYRPQRFDGSTISGFLLLGSRSFMAPPVVIRRCVPQ